MKGFKTGAQTGAGVASHGEAMGFKRGGQVKQTTPLPVKDRALMPATKKGDSAQEKAAGGRGKLKPGYKHGGTVASAAHKTLTMPAKSQGRGKKPVGRGAKAVGKGGKVGKHMSGRITKKG